MALVPFLAMTAAEILETRPLPPGICWMACHFSPYSIGLSNLPRTLPPGSVLMVDDITPIRGHDPGRILRQLSECAETLHCQAVLLDFQRPDVEETAALVEVLTGGLPCPVAVSHHYAGTGSFPVCLPPVPPSEPPEVYFSSWKDREIWLELALDGVKVTVTESGCCFLPLAAASPVEPEFFDETLLCRYHCDVREDTVRFTLRRSPEDLEGFLTEVEKHGVTKTVALYQEFSGL
jgi:hypothetical protein